MTGLIADDEPHPLDCVNPDGASPFLLVCEHAGRLIPRSFGSLGLPASEQTRHIAWDIGAREIAVALSAALDAPLYMQRYSRLVCDCNRRPDVPGFAPDLSELTSIPGNAGLTPALLEARRQAVWSPFHDAVSAALDARRAAGQPTFLVTIHSFTPVYKGVPRPWEIGVLYNRDRQFAPAALDYLRRHSDHTVGDNQPYAMSDEGDYTIPVHGEKRGIPCVEFEIRNDLTAGAEAIRHWSELIARTVRGAAVRVQAPAP